MSVSQEKAKSYLMAGLSVLPANTAQKRPCLLQWNEFQTRLPTKEEVRRWFVQPQDAQCLVCGKVSDNLEIIDFDNHGELFPKWKESIPEDLLARLVIEQTQSGGYHVAYRYQDEVCGSFKLAEGERNGKMTTLIETRGKGGLILCAPSDGYTLTQGDYTALPVLTKKERDTLLWAAYRLDERPHNPEPERLPDGGAADTVCGNDFTDRPGDDFNARGDVRSVLIKHGWTSLGVQSDGNEHWRRPGKTEGNSATLKDGVFYVFSSNAAPFEPEHGYSPFHVYSLLEHGGDFGKAAAALSEEGYGSTHVELLPNIDEIVASFMKNSQDKDVFTAAELIRHYDSLKEPMIDGLLRRSEVMNIVAAPKTGKSWLILQLAYSLVFGLDWMGFRCRKSKVLIMDNELHKETISSRLLRVAKGMNLPHDAPELENLIINTQRLKRRSIPDIVRVAEQIKEQQINVVIIDALYRALPSNVDENSNGQITGIYNDLDVFAQKSGAAVILVHHTSKGNQANKGVTDIGAGAGAQSRAPDTHLVLRPHQESGAVVVGCCVRSFPQIPAFCLRKDENNLWKRADELCPDDLEGKTELTPTGEKRKRTVDDAAVDFFTRLAAMKFPLPKTVFSEQVREQLKLSQKKTDALFDLLIQKRILEVHSGEGGSQRPAVKMVHLSPGYRDRINDVLDKSERPEYP